MVSTGGAIWCSGRVDRDSEGLLAALQRLKGLRPTELRGADQITDFEATRIAQHNDSAVLRTRRGPMDARVQALGADLGGRQRPRRGHRCAGEPPGWRHPGSSRLGLQRDPGGAGPGDPGVRGGEAAAAAVPSVDRARPHRTRRGRGTQVADLRVGALPQRPLRPGVCPRVRGLPTRRRSDLRRRRRGPPPLGPAGRPEAPRGRGADPRRAAGGERGPRLHRRRMRRVRHHGSRRPRPRPGKAGGRVPALLPPRLPAHEPRPGREVPADPRVRAAPRRPGPGAPRLLRHPDRRLTGQRPGSRGSRPADT